MFGFSPSLIVIEIFLSTDKKRDAWLVLNFLQFLYFVTFFSSIMSKNMRCVTVGLKSEKNAIWGNRTVCCEENKINAFYFYFLEQSSPKGACGVKNKLKKF